MAQEVETKVLDIDAESIRKKMSDLGAEEVLNTRFIVDWYRPKDTKEGEAKWFLRIRTTGDGRSEVTWKARSDIRDNIRQHKEINFSIGEPAKLADLFTELDLECYAHQEKDRVSWVYEKWRFDLDVYPGIPPFLEVEGVSEEHVKEALALLGIEENRRWADGERTLIQDVFGKNWYQMTFNE